MRGACRLTLLFAIVASTGPGCALASGIAGMTDVHSFNSQLRLLRGSGAGLKDGVAVLRKMEAEGVAPNAVT